MGAIEVASGLSNTQTGFPKGDGAMRTACGQSHVHTGLRRYAESGATLDHRTTQYLIAEILGSIGIRMVPGSGACKGVATRALEALVRAGVLTEAGDDLYHPSRSMSVLAENTPDMGNQTARE